MIKRLGFLLMACLLVSSCGGEKSVVQDNPKSNEKLLAAVKAGHSKAAKKLLVKGADPNASSGSGRTSIFHLALYQKDSETARLLIEHGADITKPDQNNIFPLSLAAQRNNAEITELLMMIAYLESKGAIANKLKK